MNFYSIAAVLIVSLVATSMALPARPAYYQQPSLYYPSLAAPQRLMLLQYVQRQSAPKTHSRLTYDASEEQQVAEESAASAEYEEPQYYGGLDADAAEITEEDVKEVVSEIPEDSEVPQVAEDLPITEGTVEVEADPEPVAVPETPAVEEPQEVANDEDAEGDTIDVSVAVPAVVSKRAPKAKPLAPLPAGTFFPINLNGHSGSAIAIANSFSTGEGGSATSHAIAYGQPETPKPKYRPDRRH